MNWKVPRIWEGGDVWILGGGPSVPKQFGIPDSVIQAVVNGTSPPSIYSPYMKFLHDKHVIGINVAYLLGPWIDMVFFGDNQFFLPHKEKLARFGGLRVSCYPNHSSLEWVKFLGRDTEHPMGISSKPKLVSWNLNSGSAAISVAANAGAKRIFLLGFDMNINGEKRQHWHDLYSRGVYETKDRIRKVTTTFDRHLAGFPMIAQDAKKRGIEIINVSPESSITVFPKKSLKEVIDECY